MTARSAPMMADSGGYHHGYAALFSLVSRLLAFGLLPAGVEEVWAQSRALGTGQGAEQQVTTRPSNAALDIQFPDEDLSDLELLNLEVPTVVTASRREQKITAVPYAMSVITAEDIRRSGARSVPDALRLAPGVDVADLTYANSGVSPRGFHGVLSRSVLVLVDGRQLYDSVFGGTVYGSWPFQLEDIERIEVIRGPGGVTWGSNAVNGVINIITKDPREQLGLTVIGGGGSRGSNKEYLGYGFTEDKLRMRVSGEYEGSDGFEKGASLLRPLDDDYKSGRMTAHAIYDAGPRDTITISGGSNVVDGGYPLPPTVGIGMNKNSGAQSNFLLGKWSHRIAEQDALAATAYVNDFYFHPAGKASEYRYQQLALQLSHTFKPAEEHTITWGIDSRTDMVDASLADPHLLSRDFLSTAIIGGYVQDAWQVAPRWTLDLGGRVDYEFYGGFQPSARAALSYELASESVAYGAVSRAFQMMPVGLRFLDLPLLNGAARAIGRESADPETLLAYEVGYRGKFFDRLNANLALYWHDYDDVTTMSPRMGPPGLIAMDYGNRATASTYGAELDLRFALTRQLTLLGNYTYQQLNWDCAYPFTDKELNTLPAHKFMIGAQYDPIENLHLSSYLYYVDAVKTPNTTFFFLPQHIRQYFRLDLRAEYEFWQRKAFFAVGARSLLDPHHPEGGTLFQNSAEVPRMVYAEVGLHLDWWSRTVR